MLQPGRGHRRNDAGCQPAPLPPVDPQRHDGVLLAKATTDLQAEATVENLAHIDAGESREVIVPVDIRDSSGTTVVHADITMWVAPKRLTK
jgi:hypothetical protein